MKAAVLNIGDEVLLGHTINTNLAIIARKVADFGVLIEEQITIRDEKEIVIETFKNLLDKYDMVYTTGGLGPTIDDITSECIADALERELELNVDVLEKIQSFFAESGRVMTDNNRKQALFPSGSGILDNDIGTAAGYFLREGKKWIIVLPGPPMEVENILTKFLEEFGNDDKLNFKTINTYGIGESSLEFQLREMKIDKDYLVNTYFGKGGVEIKIVSEKDDETEFNKIIDRISEEFSDYVYGYDVLSMSNELLKKFKEQGKTLALAESCTGGNISAEFTTNPGASDALLCSLVTYSNESKILELGVKKETLDKYTAVSEEVAMEMLEGLKTKYKADYYAVTTGYASPTNDKKTNGLVYIGIYDREKDETIIIKENYFGSRLQIINRVTDNVFFKLIKLMN